MTFTGFVLKEFRIKVKIRVRVFVGNKVKVKLNVTFGISMMIKVGCENEI
jgi:hypothetical protein